MSDQLYKAWYEQLGHREYRLTVVMAGYGTDIDDAEAFLDGFLAKQPDVGPVVSQDADEDSIAITFSLHAKDPDHAVRLGWVVFIEGGEASGLPPGPVLRVELEPVEAEEAPTGEQAHLQPA